MKLLRTLYSLFESLGQARAATHFARQGNVEAAKRAMDHVGTN